MPRCQIPLGIERVAEKMLPQGLCPGARMHPQILGKLAAVQYRIGRTRRFFRPLRRRDGLHAAFVAGQAHGFAGQLAPRGLTAVDGMPQAGGRH